MTNEVSDRLLVTFVLLTYNHEQFIDEAIDGALSQTYSPLEIILSDDCSSDRTYDRIERAALSYHGPHKVITNRNSSNLGLSEHINRVSKISSGNLIVIAAGDDISRSERTEKLVKVWLKKGKPSVLASGFELIDTKGRFLSDCPQSVLNASNLLGKNATSRLIRLFETEFPPLWGSTAAYGKEVFEKFGPLPAGLDFEDIPLAYRAWLLGNVWAIPDRLVLYRKHSRNVFVANTILGESVESFFSIEDWLSRNYTRLLPIVECQKDDTITARNLGLIDHELADWILIWLSHRLEVYGLMAKWWALGARDRIKGLATLFRRENGKYWKWGLIRLVPKCIYCHMRFFGHRFKSAFSRFVVN